MNKKGILSTLLTIVFLTILMSILTIPASADVGDAFIKGRVLSYNPSIITNVKLLQNNIELDTQALPSTATSGQVPQDFSFDNLAPGTYSLIITKDVHTKFTLNNVLIDEDGLDLTKDPRNAIKCLTLLCGDLDNDGIIDAKDLNTVWSSLNYGKRTSDAEEPRCDLNGDGVIDAKDLNIVWSSENYGKRDVVIEYSAPGYLISITNLRTTDVGTNEVTTTVTASKDGIVYWVLLDSNSATPSADQIIAGRTSAGTIAYRCGDINVYGGIAKTFVIAGIDEETSYKLCAVAVESNGDRSDVCFCYFTTTSAANNWLTSISTPSGSNLTSTTAMATASFSNSGVLSANKKRVV